MVADVKTVENGLVTPEAIREALSHPNTTKIIDAAINQMQAENSTLNTALQGGLSIANKAVLGLLASNITKVIGDVIIQAIRRGPEQYRAETERQVATSRESRQLEGQREQNAIEQREGESKVKMRNDIAMFQRAKAKAILSNEAIALSSALEDERRRVRLDRRSEESLSTVLARTTDRAAKEACEAISNRVEDLLKTYPNSQVYISAVCNGDVARAFMRASLQDLFVSLNRTYAERAVQLDVHIFSSLQEAIDRHSCHFEANTIGYCRKAFHDEIKRSFGHEAPQLHFTGRGSHESKHIQIFTVIGLVGTPNCVSTDSEPCWWGNVDVPENLLCSALTDQGVSCAGRTETPGVQIVGRCEDGKPLHAVGTCTITTSAGPKSIFCAVSNMAQIGYDDDKAKANWRLFINEEEWNGGVKERIVQTRNPQVMFLKDCLVNVARNVGDAYFFADGRVVRYGIRTLVNQCLEQNAIQGC